MLSDDWAVFIDFYPRFMQVYRRVAKTAWFQQRQWTAFVGHYTNGIFLQLSKPHWYNYEFDGIHFELAIDKPSAEKQLASVQLHITHKSVLPDREAFNVYTIPRMLELTEAWDRRYAVSPTKLSERLNCTIPFTTTTFAPRVAEALTQVCQLDAVIDEALQTLWPSEPAC